MIINRNPFVISGYVSPDLFCDREEESRRLIQEIVGADVALISTRRMGKTGLIQHCFRHEEIARGYYTFFVDIYATKSLRDLVFSLSKVIFETLKPKGRKAVERFWYFVKSLHAGVSFDVSGNPSLTFGLGDIQEARVTLDEIFTYLEKADRPCIVAFDEFQQIEGYAEGNVEAVLRTYIQHCNNARFIFAGSQRHTMGNMFQSPSRPFYQSVSMMHLDRIPLDKYTVFAEYHFQQGEKEIRADVVAGIYERFEGITWYVQKTLHVLYNMTPAGEVCTLNMVEVALKSILESYRYTYSEILFRLPEKQKELLIAITKEGKATEITSGSFVKKYKLSSPSSVQAALKGLLEKDFVTREQNVYQVYDRFLGIWLRENY